MISIIFFTLFLNGQCPETKIVNKTDQAWTKMDEHNYQTAKRRCIVHYADAPCLKEFRKVGFQAYQAICGIY